MVEIRTRIVSRQERRELPAERRVIPARIARRQSDGHVSEGGEEITVAGRTLKCRWIEEVLGWTVTRSWFCREVPGGLVRMESTTRGEVSSQTTMVADDWRTE